MSFESEFIYKVQSELKKFNLSSNVIVYDQNDYSNFTKIVTSIIDLFLLSVRLIFRFGKKYNFVYTNTGIFQKVGNSYTDRIIVPLKLSNIIYINVGRDTIIHDVNEVKAYNIGGLVKILSYFQTIFFKRELNVYYSYKLINNFILGLAKIPNVYSLLFYNMNGLSLVFSKHRRNFNLIEVQHGTIINFPTYQIPSPIKLADVFYVKNQQTIDYLKKHLNKNFQDIEYKLLSYPKSNALFKKGKHILYASTVEFNGIHPVFLDYLKQIQKHDNSTISIRLHPREQNKITIFKSQIEGLHAKIIFDESKNWIESNTVLNLIVVSPWSSVIEDAADNQYKTIIIDEMGKNRFAHLIDDKNVFYANNLHSLLGAINYDL